MFYSPEQFPFTKILEERYPEIKSEVVSLSKDSFAAFPERRLYVQRAAEGREQPASGGAPGGEGKGWNVFGLYFFEKKLKKNCSLCPETVRALEAIPDLTTAAFSWLEPGTHIKPHVGYTTAVLRCHLGLIVPPDCALRVGNETKTWQEGKCMVFDDMTEHEAWNRSTESRVVLLLDFKKAAAHLGAG